MLPTQRTILLQLCDLEGERVKAAVQQASSSQGRAHVLFIRPSTRHCRMHSSHTS